VLIAASTATMGRVIDGRCDRDLAIHLSAFVDEVVDKTGLEISAISPFTGHQYLRSVAFIGVLCRIVVITV